MAKSKDDDKGRIIKLPSLNEDLLDVEIIGTMSYIQNGFPKAAIAALGQTRAGGTDKPIPKDTKGQEDQDPDAEALSKMHIIDEAYDKAGEIVKAKCLCGIPVSALQKSITTAAWQVNSIPKKQILAAIAVEGHEGGSFVPFKHNPKKFDIRQGWGKVNRKLLIFYQPVFSDWKAHVTVRFDRAMIDKGTVLQLVRNAGSKVGIGNNRREVGGECGTFRIGKVVEVKR